MAYKARTCVQIRKKKDKGTKAEVEIIAYPEGPTEVSGKLPYPPSVNNYWRSGVRRHMSTGLITKNVFKNEKAQQYMKEVYWMMKQQKIPELPGRSFRLELYIYPPDKRRRDIDNLCKGSIDSLQYSEIIKDDFLIDELYVERRTYRVGGEVEFVLRRLR